MEEDKIIEKESKGPNRKVLFVVGIVFGLALGAGVTMFLVNLMHLRHQAVEKQEMPVDPSGKSDTVVQYVIHQYAAMSSPSSRAAGDSLDVDTLSEDLSQDLMMDEDELREVEELEEADAYVKEEMLTKTSARITYLDNNKMESAVPANAMNSMTVQLWSTPFKNKRSYWFNGSVLKVKGVNVENCSIVHFKNAYYLKTSNHVYHLIPNKQFEKMIEVPELTFPQ